MTTATDVGFVEMRIAKVVGVHAAEDEVVRCAVVLDEVAGGPTASYHGRPGGGVQPGPRLGGIQWRRPMTYQFTAALVQALGGRVRHVQIDRLVEGGLRGHRRGGRPAWRAVGRRAAQRRAEPGGAGGGADLRRSRGAARRGGGTSGRGRRGSPAASGAGGSADDGRNGGDVGPSAVTNSGAGGRHGVRGRLVRRVLDARVTYSVVVGKGGACPCPFGVRRQEGVGRLSATTMPPPRQDKTHEPRIHTSICSPA